MDRNRIIPLACLPLIALFLVACVRSASTPPPEPAAGLEAPSPTPLAVPFPLAPATTWIYEYEAHAENEQAAWVITDTILAIEERDGLLVARVERLLRLQDGRQPTEALITAPRPDPYWYILRGGELFRQFEQPESEKPLSNALLEMVFPPESVPCWPVDDDILGPLEQGTSGCRYISNRLPVYETPAGTFENCLELLTPYLSGGILTVFCPEIGFVAEKYEHAGSPFGYEMILIGYSLQTR